MARELSLLMLCGLTMLECRWRDVERRFQPVPEGCELEILS